MRRAAIAMFLSGCASLGVGCQCGGSTAPEPQPLMWSMGEPAASAPPPAQAEDGQVEALQQAIETLEPLHADKKKPGPSDWLARHQEPGQSFEQYRKDDPVLPDLDAGAGKRHTIYIQPLGKLQETHTKIVGATAELMHHFFGVPVSLRDFQPLSTVPAKARRIHPEWGKRQILTSYVLDEVLKPQLPADAAAFISFTASDLWPGKGWNFVFGQASLTERVGVWSVHRYGDPDLSPEAYQRALMRTFKVAVHETGHMFSMKHCTAHECVMGGSNNLDETDRAPVWLCPQCMAKMCWGTRRDPADRYRDLAAFMAEHGFADEAAFYERSRTALEQDAARRKAALKSATSP